MHIMVIKSNNLIKNLFRGVIEISRLNPVCVHSVMSSLCDLVFQCFGATKIIGLKVLIVQYL